MLSWRPRRDRKANRRWMPSRSTWMGYQRRKTDSWKRNTWMQSQSKNYCVTSSVRNKPVGHSLK